MIADDNEGKVHMRQKARKGKGKEKQSKVVKSI
jgi:hypothetical protein